MNFTRKIRSAFVLGLDSDLTNLGDLTDLVRGAGEVAMYLWNNLSTEELAQVTADLRQFLVDWDPATVREIEHTINCDFDDEEQKTLLRPGIERIVAELENHVARSGGV